MQKQNSNVCLFYLWLIRSPQVQCNGPILGSLVLIEQLNCFKNVVRELKKLHRRIIIIITDAHQGNIKTDTTETLDSSSLCV